MIKLGGSKTLSPQIETYPSYGFETGRGDWLINVRGITYQTPPFNLRQKMLLKMLTGVMKASETDLKSPTFQSRIWPFFVEGLRGQKIQIELNGKIYQLRKKSRRNGRFDSWIRLDNSIVRQAMAAEAEGPRRLQFRLSTKHMQSPCVQADIALLPAGGLSVISDIDDTIKESHVANRRELLMNTFVREFQSVDGMSEVYREWQSDGACFHYVSSSPWQLYESLSAMRCEFGFPSGTMHLRDFRLRDQFLTKLMFRRQGKALEIRKLVKNLPNRKFILIGDSGEKDPEIYHKIARKYPNQVRGIFIRNLATRPMDTERVARLRRSSSGSQSSIFIGAEELAQQALPLIEQFGGQLVSN